MIWPLYIRKTDLASNFAWPTFCVHILHLHLNDKIGKVGIRGYEWCISTSQVDDRYLEGE